MDRKLKLELEINELARKDIHVVYRIIEGISTQFPADCLALRGQNYVEGQEDPTYQGIFMDLHSKEFVREHFGKKSQVAFDSFNKEAFKLFMIIHIIQITDKALIGHLNLSYAMGNDFFNLYDLALTAYTNFLKTIKD